MLQVSLFQDVWLWLYFIHGLVSGVSHGLGLGLGFLHIVELWFWHLQHPSLSLMMLQVLLSQDVWLFIDGLMSGLSHGLGLGLRFSHIVELWFWCLQGPSLSLGGC